MGILRQRFRGKSAARVSAPSAGTMPHLVAIWTLARDSSSGLISCDWAGPYDPNTDGVNSLSSAAMTLAVTARILGAAVVDVARCDGRQAGRPVP